MGEIYKNTNVRSLNNDIKFSKRIESLAKSSKMPDKEKPFGGKLNALGRKAYFDEYFYGIKLEDQILPSVGCFDDPRETVSFKLGYQRGEFLVQEGMIPEEYQISKNNNLHR